VDILDDTYVRKFELQPFAGSRQGIPWRIWTISWFNFQYQWNRSRALKIVVALIFFLLLLSNIMILFGPYSSGITLDPNTVLEDHLWGNVRKFVRFQVLIAAPDEIDPVFDTGYSILFLIGLILMGSGLISDDRKNRMDEIYDSKINRYVYLLGKFGSLVLFGNVLLVFPSLIEWVLLLVGIEGVDIIQALPTLIGVIFFAEIVILSLTVVILSFSSLFNSRIYSSILVFGFFLAITSVFSSGIGNNQAFTPLMYLDLFTVLSVFSFLLQGEQSVIYYDITNDIPTHIILDLTKEAGILLLPFLLAFIFLNCFLCYYRVVWKFQSPLHIIWGVIRSIFT
jgi:ABC-type transport system involved in multi-copper enzyme maturation permease subunit